MDANPRWTRRPAGSTWGDWGPDDQLGRLNLLTTKKVLQGIAEVKEGRVFCLSLPLVARRSALPSRVFRSTSDMSGSIAIMSLLTGPSPSRKDGGAWPDRGRARPCGGTRCGSWSGRMASSRR